MMILRFLFYIVSGKQLIPNIILQNKKIIKKKLIMSHIRMMANPRYLIMIAKKLHVPILEGFIIVDG